MMQRGRMEMRWGQRRVMGSVKSYPSSESEARGVESTSPLEVPSEVEDETERAGEWGASSSNMRSGSPIEKVKAERVMRDVSNFNCCGKDCVGRAVAGE